MHKRSLLVGLGLGLLLAGFAAMCANTGRWHAWRGAPPAAVSERAASGSDAVNADTYRYEARGYGGMHGWHGPHFGFFAFPFMFLSCLLPILLIGMMFGFMRRMRWHRWHGRHGWHHGHDWHHGGGTPPIV